MPHRELNYVQAPVIIPVRPRMDMPETFITTDTRIELYTDTPDTKIYFSSDGSEPDPFHRTQMSKQKTHKYKGPFSLLQGTRTVRAIAVTRNMRFQSHITTRTFIVRDSFTFGVDLNRPNDDGSVISLVSNTDSDLTTVSHDVDLNHDEERMLQHMRRSRESRDFENYRDLEIGRRSYRGQHDYVRDGWSERERPLSPERFEGARSPGILRDAYSDRSGIGSSRVHFASYDSFQHTDPPTSRSRSPSSRSRHTQRSARSFDPSLETSRLLNGFDDQLDINRTTRSMENEIAESEIDKKLQELDLQKELRDIDVESEVKTETDVTPPTLNTYRKGEVKDRKEEKRQKDDDENDDETYILSSDDEKKKRDKDKKLSKEKKDKKEEDRKEKRDRGKREESAKLKKTKSQKSKKKDRSPSSSSSSSSSSSEAASSTVPSSAAAAARKSKDSNLRSKSSKLHTKESRSNGVNYYDMSTEEVIQSVRMSSRSPQSQQHMYPGPQNGMGYPLVQAQVIGPSVYPLVFGGPPGVTYVQNMNPPHQNINMNGNLHPLNGDQNSFASPSHQSHRTKNQPEAMESSTARSTDSSTVVSEMAPPKRTRPKTATKSNGVPVVASRSEKQKTAPRNSRTASLQDFLTEDNSKQEDSESEVSVAVRKTQSYPIEPNTQAENQFFDCIFDRVKKFFEGWGSNDVNGSDKPQDATPVGRSGRNDEKIPTYNQIVKRCLKSRKLWEDLQFPANHGSLYLDGSGDRQVEWKRPHEISRNPKFFVGGASRLDVKQGVLGNCWLLAAVSSLCADEEMFHQVVPTNQSFKENYCGVFRFVFWQYGKWVEVCVDDRLPTINGKLMYMHSESQNEFWSPLMEKAYAKLCGCYEALSGGLASEAMTDFTGGVTERFNFREEVPDNMFQILTKAKHRHSLMGCSIDAKPDEMEARLENGLILGHAYSITDVNTVQTQRGPVDLIRVRNPWGNSAEWNGPWGDRSKEWQSVSEEEREKIGLEIQHDGEFWMSYKDFVTHFQRVEICNVVTETGDEQWHTTLLEGAWIKRVNAGGCRNHPASYSKNPQYRVRVTDPDEEDEEEVCTVIVGLMQRDRRKLRKKGMANLTIGFDIYDVSNRRGDALDKRFFSRNHPVATSPQFINMREVCGRYRLPPGQYCIIPTTFEPNEEGSFLIRVYTEKDSDLMEVDSVTTRVAVSQNEATVNSAPITTALDSNITDEAQNQFESRCGEDQQVDAYELQAILNETFAKGFQFGEFDINLCRSMVALRDVDHSGMLAYDEFKVLWQELCTWKVIYKQYDTDNSGHLSSFELREALKSSGFQTSNATFKAIVMRYCDRQGHLKYDDFVACVIKLKSMFAIHQQNVTDEVASFGLDKFIQMTMYS